jgi:undecaprenyl-diphosphatase
MNISDIPVLFDVLLHCATLCSVLVVFRKRIAGIIVSLIHFITKKRSIQDDENLALIIPMLVATIITAVFGLFLSKIVKQQNISLVSVLFLVTAFILIISSRFKGQAGYKEIGLKQGLVTGFAQGLGVLPGISRSGITISAGVFSGINRETSAEFAFLLAIPAILGAVVLELRDLESLKMQVDLMQILVSFLTAFLSGIGALKLLMPLIKKGRLWCFALYLIPLGIIGLVFL